MINSSGWAIPEKNGKRGQGNVGLMTVGAIPLIWHEAS